MKYHIKVYIEIEKEFLDVQLENIHPENILNMNSIKVNSFSMELLED